MAEDGDLLDAGLTAATTTKPTTTTNRVAITDSVTSTDTDAF